MAHEDEKEPKIALEEADLPEENRAQGADPHQHDSASAAPPSVAGSMPISETVEAKASAPERDSAEGAPGDSAPQTAGEARRYRPTEDYAVGDRILHPVWNATGVVTYRDPREQVFRISIGRSEERGRCRVIRVQFEQEVPASGGPRREVTLIADWRGRPFEIGAPPPQPEETGPILPLLGVAERPTAARGHAPLLPEIPEPEEIEEEEEIDDETQEESEEEGIDPLEL